MDDEPEAGSIDAGFTGPHDGVIGREAEPIIRRFLTNTPQRFEVAKDRVLLQGVAVFANGALRLDGVDDFVSVPNMGNVMPTTEITIDSVRAVEIAYGGRFDENTSMRAIRASTGSSAASSGVPLSSS